MAAAMHHLLPHGILGKGANSEKDASRTDTDAALTPSHTEFQQQPPQPTSPHSAPSEGSQSAPVRSPYQHASSLPHHFTSHPYRIPSSHATLYSQSPHATQPPHSPLSPSAHAHGASPMSYPSHPSPLQYHPNSSSDSYHFHPSYASSASSRSATDASARSHDHLLISHWPTPHTSSDTAVSPTRVLDVPPSHRPVGHSLKHLRADDFALLKTLGTGTFARVWLAQWAHPRDDREAQQVYALKILRKVDVVRLKQVEHVRNERTVLAAVAGHPFITTLIASFQDADSLYMLLDYCPGGEVFSYLRRARRFNEATSRFYAAEIVLILEYLHEKEGVAYRDLKPENILIDAEGHLKLVDFGFAKTVGDRETYTLCGTPEYLAPEVIRNTGHGRAVDWWAFGILIYEFLVGQPPFWDQNPIKIYEQIIEGHIRFPSAMPPDARDLISKLCTVDTSKRLGNIQGGAAAVKAHPWFRGVDWDAVYRRASPGPIVPQLRGPADTRHFDDYEPEPEGREAYTEALREKYEESFKDF